MQMKRFAVGALLAAVMLLSVAAVLVMAQTSHRSLAQHLRTCLTGRSLSDKGVPRTKADCVSDLMAAFSPTAASTPAPVSASPLSEPQPTRAATVAARGAVPSALIQPSDFAYLGAFRLEERFRPNYATLEYSNGAVAYYPSGDPASSDATPGSLFISGHT